MHNKKRPVFLSTVTSAVSCQTDRSIICLDVPLELRTLREHAVPPTTAPLRSWSLAQKRLHLGEAVFSGPRIDQLPFIARMVTTVSTEVVLPVEPSDDEEEEEVFVPVMRNCIVQTDISGTDLAVMSAAEREELFNLREEVVVLREGIADWNSESKWVHLASTDEGKRFMESRMEEFIEQTVQLILSDETRHTEGQEYDEQMERVQVRTAMLLRLKAIQAVQSQMPEDLIHIDERFVGIKLEFPKELVTYFKARAETPPAPVPDPVPVTKVSKAAPKGVLAKLRQTSERLLKHGEIRRENFYRLKNKVNGTRK